MSTYTLLHGAWMGSWCWDKVSSILSNRGHKVFAPNLPGRPNQTAQHKLITLDTYTQYLCQILDTLSEPVILVGHSMGGVIISQVAEYRPEKIKKLIYLSAFQPQNGESLFELVNRFNHPSIEVKLDFDMENRSVRIEKNNLIELFYHDCPEKLGLESIENMCVEPMNPMMTKVKLGNSFDEVAKEYIECLDDRMLTLSAQREMNGRHGCPVRSLPSGHSPFFSMPDKLADML